LNTALKITGGPFWLKFSVVVP